MGHLRDQARLGRIGDIENAERHRRSTEVRQVNIAAMLHQLHAVAMAVQIVMADHAHVPAFAFRLNRFDLCTHGGRRTI